MALRLVVIDPELRIKANRMTNNPSMMVIQVAAPAKHRANGDTTCHTPSNRLAMSHLAMSHLPPFLL
jgi:hypothetical protein